MNRIILGAALAVALSGSAYAAAATGSATPAPSTAPMTTPAPPAKPDTAAECKDMGTQWEAAETANATNPKLAKAKVKAKAAEKNCASTKTSKQKVGISQYKAVLKLLGVKPTT